MLYLILIINEDEVKKLWQKLVHKLGNFLFHEVSTYVEELVHHPSRYALQIGPKKGLGKLTVIGTIYS